MIVAIASVTVRALLARRRALLMVLLAAVPVLIGLVARLRGVQGDPTLRTAEALEPLAVATVLPLVALVFGTAALGGEIEDGSAIHLLTKPVERWRIVAAKVLAAAPVTALLAGVSTLLAGLLIGGERGTAGVTLAFTAGVLVGSVLYATVFVALSVLTTRALFLGLAYVAIWEGAVAGLFEGTRVLSVRQYVMAVVRALDPSGATRSTDALAIETALPLAIVVLVAAFWIGVRRLRSYQLAAGD